MRAAAAAAAALCAAGAGAAAPELTVLMFDSHSAESPTPLEQQLKSGGWKWSKIGQGSQWLGFGTKVRGIIKALAAMEPSDLVVVTDAYDVLLNPIAGAARVTAEKVAAVVASRPGTVVASAESQCCVNALSHVRPGALIAQNGSRVGKACSSRDADCKWHVGGEAPWVEFMTSLARTRSPRSGEVNPYLNAGVVAGQVSDLLAVYSALKAANDEDDQALMTEYMFRHPERVLLDYDQELFGNNRWRKGLERGCMFMKAEDGGHLVHLETGTTPAFLHTSGQFWGCYSALADAAGVTLPEEVRNRKAGPLGYTNGDPFTTYAGKTTQFYLPLGVERKLISCGNVDVHGRTMSSGIAGDSQQWFDKIRVSESGTELASVGVLEGACKGCLGTAGEAPHDDDVSVRVGEALSLIRGMSNGKKGRAPAGAAAEALTTLAVNVSGAPRGRTTAVAAAAEKVTVHRDAQPIGTCCFAERVDVATASFGMEVRSSVANKFRAAADRVGKLHLDIAFTELDASACTGMLPEIWGVRPITREHAKLLSPPQ